MKFANRFGAACAMFVLLAFGSLQASAQVLTKTAVSVDAGNTKQTGQTFGYRLTYNCSNTSGPCLNAEVDDLLPPEVQYVSTVPASPTGDVAAINVTANYMGSGRTRVQFVMVNPLTAGNSGDLLINVRFPNGTTPDGTVATNTADGVNLSTTPGTFTTPPVDVTAKATMQVNLQKTLQTGPANLDMPETYRLRISVPNSDGTLGLTAIGPVVDTLPTGTVFNGATPAADCEPGCVGTTPATLTWSGPCAVPLNPNGTCDIQVHVTFPSATFASGTSVTNTFTAQGTPRGGGSTDLGTGTVTHPVTTFVPAPGATLGKGIDGGSPNPPTLGQTFSYNINVANSGNVPLDGTTVIDTLPVQFNLASVTTGSYSNLADFAAGEGVRVSYEKNTAAGVFTLWGSSPNTTTNTTLTAPPPGLGAGEYVTRIRWEYGQAAPGMGAGTRPFVTGRIVNPDNAGNPVAIGDSIQNCVDLAAVYAAGPTNVTRNACNTFTLSGPFVQLNPAKDNLSGGGPFNPGQTVNWRLRVRSDARSSDAAPLENLVAADLLPVDLTFASWTFDDQGSGLPAPQSFEQIPNYANTGRTLLRWKWNAGSGNLGVNQQVWINVSTKVRNGAAFGSLSNNFDLTGNSPGLGQRCTTGGSNSSVDDALDLDGDGSATDKLCQATGTITVAPIAHLISSKTIQGTCDATSTSTSQGTLLGGNLVYTLHVQNDATVPMQHFVLVDILPFVGDSGVRDTSPRGSQWTPALTAPITPPPGTTLYYSTSGNPCRGEVGGPTTSCDAPNWTTVPPVPISGARSFKIDFGDRVVGPQDTIDFAFSMVAPADLSAGPQAYNSFAYQADRADGLGSLAAEPQKVGIGLGDCEAASLGDYVWVDADKNGVQDDGPTGLNDVYVRLFSPGPDGIAGNGDDVPLSSTLTANGPDGAPGWYQFPGLAPGGYYVCVTPPPTFTVTARDAGGDDAKDSDIDPATACTAPVTLAAGEHDPTLDAGLVTTHLAALGNYVWFDRNGDGVQNEASSDGVNGVTVKLYADNGDGNPDPATDSLVATTVTADDVYGHPGYYLFDRLIPGIRYFVQFVKPASASAFTTRDAGGDDALDSDADTTTGLTPEVVLAPDEVNLTIDAGLVSTYLTQTGPLALGNQVWRDANNDGVFEPQSGEAGIDGVRLDLYVDANHNGAPDAGEYLATTSTATINGFAGRYGFDHLTAGDYIVVVHPSNFAGGGALAGLATATGNDPAPDPDDDVDGDDNGTNAGALVASLPITLASGAEPTSEDGDADTNLTLDFGFITASPATQYYDYGDAPDAGTVGPGSYNTTAFDNGPSHRVGVPGAPYLGQCVDADDGTQQNAAADADDAHASPLTVGTCATPGDDEDGVAFSDPFIAGQTASFTVTATGTCSLNAWVDWNGNGTFDAGEQIASNISLTGTMTLSPTVPANAVAGVAYARFRCSTQTDLGPTGPAPDGEVEDYRVHIQNYDFGDAPDSYGTTLAQDGARHLVDLGNDPLRLGQCVDVEADGQPGVGADGDDSAAGQGAGLCFDDEDGVTLPTAIAACGTVSVPVIASAAGKLDAWVDFNRNGVFDAGEEVFTDQTVVAGNNALSFNVPCNAQGGQSYARFRLSSTGGLGPTGAADDGEVEDYAVKIGANDFGDAPDSYGTTIAQNGAHHLVVDGFSLGATVDSEPDGQPSVDADGDGADEDGVTLPAQLVACSAQTVTVALTDTAGIADPKLDAWIDFDHDGHFDDPRDRVASGQVLAAGSNTLTVNVPCDTKIGASYARFRLSSAGVATPTGAADDGEVEDYKVELAGLDFGDAPDPTYPTLLASNGPRHVVDPAHPLYLGACVDTEADAHPAVGATGDDAAAGSDTLGTCATPGDDEDGVTFTSPLQQCGTTNVSVVASAAGKLDAWIDFDHNGSFDAGEEVFTDTALVAGANALSFAVPCGAAGGQAYARFRFSSAGGLAPTGLADDGEIEDHVATVIANAPQIGLAKRLVSATPDAANHNLFHLSFAFDLVNSGNADLTDVQVVDDLATTFAGALSYSVQGVTTSGAATVGANGGYNGGGDTSLLAAGSTLAAGASATITLNVDIVVDAVRSFNNVATANGNGPGGTPVGDTSQDGGDPDPDHNGDPGDNGDPTPVVLPQQVAQIGLAKRLVGVVPAGGGNNHVTFAFVVANSGNADLSNVAVTDDLQATFAGAASFHVTGVVASGTLVANPAFDGVANQNLLAAGSTLAAGTTATITLSVDVVVTETSDFANSATVTATTSVGDHPVGDTSQNGSDPDPDHNGNPGDNGDPTPVSVSVTPAAPTTPVPGLGPLGMLLFFALLAMLGARDLRRRAARRADRG